jgi:multidrug efflux pump subunit AcrB
LVTEAEQLSARQLLPQTKLTLRRAALALIPGEGTELYRGVGIIVLCGLLFSTQISLTFLPALLVSVLGRIRRQVQP